jgi:NAD(P)-dependent dehydrogenase (short-subunit alcohol dehydrogenase family)
MKTIFITGATSGIGQIAACELAAKGNKIIATARNIDRAKELLLFYKLNYPKSKGSIHVVICDLLSLKSIKEACEQVISENSYIDVIINNAGIWNFSYRESQDKIEAIFQVNVLAPLLINCLLLDLLSKSKEAKSIFTASGLHQGKINFSDLENKKNFSGFNAYRQSKLEVILLCRLLAKKLATFDVGVYCQHPGLVDTHLGRDANWFSNLFFRLFGLPAKKGALTLIYLAEENKNNLTSGEYYYKMKIRKTTTQSNDLLVAQKLLDVLESYIKNYLPQNSFIFKNYKNEISN